MSEQDEHDPNHPFMESCADPSHDYAADIAQAATGGPDFTVKEWPPAPPAPDERQAGLREALTPEAERQLRRDADRGGPVTPGDVLALFATLDEARAALVVAQVPAQEERLRKAVEDVLTTLERVVSDSESQHPGGWGPDVTTVADLRDCQAVLHAALGVESSTAHDEGEES